MKLNVFVPCLYIICSMSSISGSSVDPNDISSVYIGFAPQKPEAGETFIVGGENAKDGQAPFMCSLQFFSSHDCGCAILSSKFVITAAHCVYGMIAEQLRVLVGTNNLKGNGDYYSVTRIIKHEKFIWFSNGYDIAVVEVNGPISFNDKVQPIMYSTKEPPHGSLAQLTGWGRIRTNGPSPDQLQVINMPVVSTVACREILGSDVHDSHICAFAKEGRGACYVCRCENVLAILSLAPKADSGSPLVLANEIIGVVNFGRAPCAQGYPDAFAKISYFAGWIKSTTGIQA